MVFGQTLCPGSRGPKKSGRVKCGVGSDMVNSKIENGVKDDDNH